MGIWGTVSVAALSVVVSASGCTGLRLPESWGIRGVCEPAVGVSRYYQVEAHRSAIRSNENGDAEQIDFRVSGTRTPNPECPRVNVSARASVGIPGIISIDAPIRDGILTVSFAHMDRRALLSNSAYSLVSYEIGTSGTSSLTLDLGPFAERARREAEREKEEEARKEAARQAEDAKRIREAEVQREQERAVLVAHVQTLGLQLWQGACRNTDVLYGDACLSLDSSYDRGVCEDVQRTARKASYVFHIENANRLMEFDAKRNEFKVQVPALLDGDIDIADCVLEGCFSRVITTKKFNPPKGKAKYPEWERRFEAASRPFIETVASFTVPIDKLPTAESADDIVVDLLVVPLDTDDLVVGEWFEFHNARVRIVGAQAYLPDLSWGRSILKPSKRNAEFVCPF